MRFNSLKRNVTTSTRITSKIVDKDYTQSHYSSLVIDNKINEITADLPRECANTLHRISEENASVIIDYIHAMKTEINPSINYKRNNIILLCKLSRYHDNYSFRYMNRENILTFLDSFRKPEATDPLHKWIGTYNTFRMQLIRFFKWLNYPDNEQHNRTKPPVIENIPQLNRKEKSIYKPTDLWTAEDDALFLKYCPSNRNRCFHAMSWDTGCRPHELLKLRIKDIIFKSAGNRQYAEILVNGKTGPRHIPLIDSIPYVKDYLNHEHPQSANPNAIFLCGSGKSLGRVLGIVSLYRIYKNYRTDFFPKLLVDPNVQPEDKQRIRELLKKPWNPYIRRHSALTEKSKILKEHTLRQFAGWTIGSNMPQKYLHYFGNEASESLLEAYGIITKDNQQKDALRPKQCPNCSEPNKPDSKFCARCRMILSYDAYEDTVNNKQERDDAISILSDQVMELMAEVQELKRMQ